MSRDDHMSKSCFKKNRIWKIYLLFYLFISSVVVIGNLNLNLMMIKTLAMLAVMLTLCEGRVMREYNKAKEAAPQEAAPKDAAPQSVTPVEMVPQRSTRGVDPKDQEIKSAVEQLLKSMGGKYVLF